MELRKEIDINNLQKVRVVRGTEKGRVGVVFDYYEKDGEFLVAFGESTTWHNSRQLEVIEEEKELTVREVVESNVHIEVSDGDIWEHIHPIDIEEKITLQQLTYIIRTKPTESELIEKFKSLSMEEKVELLKNTK